MKRLGQYLSPALAAMLILFSTVTWGENEIRLQEGKGTIHRIDLSAQVIVVDDVLMILGSGYSVRNKTGKSVSAFNLQAGKKVRVRYAPGMIVREIILLN